MWSRHWEVSEALWILWEELYWWQHRPILCQFWQSDMQTVVWMSRQLQASQRRVCSYRTVWQSIVVRRGRKWLSYRGKEINPKVLNLHYTPCINMCTQHSWDRIKSRVMVWHYLVFFSKVGDEFWIWTLICQINYSQLCSNFSLTLRSWKGCRSAHTWLCWRF